MLDTDFLKGRLPEVSEHLRGMPSDQLGTTSITAVELRFGALNSGHPEKNLARSPRSSGPLAQTPFDQGAAVQYGNLKRFLTSRGQLIGIMDLLIASCVLAVGGVLVTNNVREFVRVPSAGDDFKPYDYLHLALQEIRRSPRP